VQELETILLFQADAADLDDPQPFMASDEAFHRKLADLAGQSAGWEFLQPLKTQMDRVRHLSAQQVPAVFPGLNALGPCFKLQTR
jgi:DNA-binding GntR family transcriptional regulator